MAQMTFEIEFPVWNIELWVVRVNATDGRYNYDLKLFGLL